VSNHTAQLGTETGTEPITSNFQTKFKSSVFDKRTFLLSMVNVFDITKRNCT